MELAAQGQSASGMFHYIVFYNSLQNRYGLYVVMTHYWREENKNISHENDNPDTPYAY